MEVKHGEQLNPMLPSGPLGGVSRRPVIRSVVALTVIVRPAAGFPFKPVQFIQQAAFGISYVEFRRYRPQVVQIGYLPLDLMKSFIQVRHGIIIIPTRRKLNSCLSATVAGLPQSDDRQRVPRRV
jgi:hypothetical protein